MTIINSAAYVVPEFRVEFGAIPPCMLPVGNHKLIEYQVPALRLLGEDRIIVSLPDSFKLNIDENKLLNELGVDIVFCPVDFSLAESVLHVLNVTDESYSLKLLHGDTLVDYLPVGGDNIGVVPIVDDYSWEKEIVGFRRSVAWAGYFSFSQPKQLIKCLALSRGDFVKSIRMYEEQNKMSLVTLDNWYDLGHINTYFMSRTKITTQRVFNDLKIDDGMVWKSGNQSDKIEAEANWFHCLPSNLRKYIPQLIDYGVDIKTKKQFYSLEYLPCVPLNEVFVHGRNPDFYWKKIFDLIGKFLSDACDQENFKKIPIDKDKICTDAVDLYVSKTKLRIQEYMKNSTIDFEIPIKYNGIVFQNIHYIVEDCINRAKNLPVIISILHGDLCFSNILFDSRIDRIKLIDPRGINQNKEKTILGDQKYDIAKVAHSVIGLYDFIIAGRFKIINDEINGKNIKFDIDERVSNIQTIFLNTKLSSYIAILDVMPLVALLFFSMLPLHSDRPDRQEAMLLNAIRIYACYVVNSKNT
jgi:hypothetical protein